MREIKVRAWDLDLKKMKQVLSVEWLDEVYVTYWNEPGVARANTVLMQYTGLKDKNGKEIYEGDVLLSDDGEESFRCKITWVPDKAGYEIFAWCGGYEWDNCFDWEPESKDGVPILTDFEVIGNIYEHKHLLNEQ